jgi:glycerophosphoryl diester phosphodiesterase
MHGVKRSKGWLMTLLIAGSAIFASLYFANASWVADHGHGTPRVIAQRGVSQTYSLGKITDDSCTARFILPPSHALIDNTLPSLEAAIEAGADVVEIDIRATGDHQFVLFHDDGLACRTEGSGRISEHSVSELKTLDVGYGYTADGGKTFPLRGKGVGLMPTLAEVLQKYPDQRFLIQIKDGARSVADSLVAYLRANQIEASDRLTFFGGVGPLRRLRKILPLVRTWSAGSAGECLFGYLETGWFGRVPRACDDGIIIVPIEQADLLWGWPNRFLERMRGHRTEVMLVGKIDSIANGQWSRLDTLQELSRVPIGFDGSIWTDQIRVTGPAIRRLKVAVAADASSSMGTSPPRFITSGPGFIDYWPVFSPDGKNVLFSRSFDGGKTWDLWIVPTEGGEARKFAHTPMLVSANRANWSSKRNLIAFTGLSGTKANVWIIGADGSDPHEMPATGLSNYVLYPSWYPDGQQVAVMDSVELNIKRIDLAQDRAEVITDRNHLLTGMPAVSPDGRSIAFAGQPNAGQRYDQTQNTIWLLELSTGAVHSLEATPQQGRAPSWSPDTTQLAFESDRGGQGDSHLYAAFIVGRDGTGLRRVTEPEFNANHPVWSPDGKRLVIAANWLGNRPRIAIVDLGR